MLSKKNLLNIFYIVIIVCYALVIGHIFSTDVNLKRGKIFILSEYELGAILGSLLSFIIITIASY